MKSSLLLSIGQKILTIPLMLVIANRLSDAATAAMAGDAHAVIRTALITLALLMLVTIIEIGGNTIIRRQIARATQVCKLDFLAQLLANPLHVLHNARHGELTENLNDDIIAATNRYTKLYPAMITGALTALGYVGYLWPQSRLIVISLIAIALLQFVPPMIVKNFMQINYEQCREIEADMSEHVIEAVNGFETIKLFRLSDWWLGKMAGYHRNYLRIGKRTDAMAAAHISMYKLLDNILKYGTYALMGLYTLSDRCTMPTAMQAIVLSGGLYEAVKAIFSAIPELAIAKAADARLDKWRCAQASNIELPRDDSITLDALTYAPILSDISARFDEAKRLLIAGKNGSGKSTLLNIIAGVALPTDGAVRVGGISPSDFADDAYPRKLLYIPQHDPEFDFPAATLFDMFGASEKAKLDAVAERLGLPHERIERAAMRELSGGERKKVMLCIGFALDPDILLLDEPSNSLDATAQSVLSELIAERTKRTLMVSHDPRYRADMDSIHTLQDGGMHYEPN